MIKEMKMFVLLPTGQTCIVKDSLKKQVKRVKTGERANSLLKFVFPILLYDHPISYYPNN
ncbi:hypothetical protein Hanom_Chr08g00718241 [Helianthus anomalus]